MMNGMLSNVSHVLISRLSYEFTARRRPGARVAGRPGVAGVRAGVWLEVVRSGKFGLLSASMEVAACSAARISFSFARAARNSSASRRSTADSCSSALPHARPSGS